MAGKTTKTTVEKPVRQKQKTRYPNLTAKQMHFTQLLYESGNASDAFRKSYDVGDWTPEAINVRACQLTKNDKVQLRLRELERYARERQEINVDRVVSMMGKTAFYDPRNLFTKDGDLKRVVDLDDMTAFAVAGIEFEEVFEDRYEKGRKKRIHTGRIHKIKLADRQRPLENLARFMGMYAASDGAALAQGAIALESFRRMMEEAKSEPAQTPAVDGEVLSIEDVRA